MSSTDSRVGKTPHSNSPASTTELRPTSPRGGASDDGLRHYLALVLTTGVGPITLGSLLDTFGTPEAVLNAAPGELAEVQGVGIALARRLRSSEFKELADQVIQQCAEAQIDILRPSHPRFPRLLRELPDPPGVLYVRGELKPCDGLALAIVGTRGASNYGRTQAERFGRVLARAGLTIVSGLARGIDAAAHRGAIDGGGRTIAVLSSGVHEIYPPQHEELALQIVEHGALISEMPPFMKPKKGMFPQRNRLISGLALGTLVVEAATRSGALITARHAGEQGREVFAIPGLVSSPSARGCHALIRDGAYLTEDPDDILDQLGPLVEGIQISPEVNVRHPMELTLNDQESRVLGAIGVEPTDINLVVTKSGLPVARVLSTLSVLEMRRLIRRVSGQTVLRC
ncbi:MAG: DNA-protecting protein DprA [Pirellulaceae bacterium]|nr:DNA-protecting protein DprA [Pirellulaceae bacterium]